MSDQDEKIDAVFGQTAAYTGDLLAAYHELLAAYRLSGRRVHQLEHDNAHLREQLARAHARHANERREARREAQHLPDQKLAELISGGTTAGHMAGLPAERKLSGEIP